MLYSLRHRATSLVPAPPYWEFVDYVPDPEELEDFLKFYCRRALAESNWGIQVRENNGVSYTICAAYHITYYFSILQVQSV